jgi:hypothetical protein
MGPLCFFEKKRGSVFCRININSGELKYRKECKGVLQLITHIFFEICTSPIGLYMYFTDFHLNYHKCKHVAMLLSKQIKSLSL